MADFKQAYKVVRTNEGGYANDPDDTGGETYKGISRKNWPQWKGWQIIDLGKTIKKTVAELDDIFEANTTLQELVLSFFKLNFWDVLKLDYVKDEKIATELFDTSVNMSTGKAAMFLQMALNVLNRNGKDYEDISEDHIIGPRTIEALNQHKSPRNVLKVLNCLQGARYIDIARANPKQEKFMNSWLSRVEL